MIIALVSLIKNSVTDSCVDFSLCRALSPRTTNPRETVEDTFFFGVERTNPLAKNRHFPGAKLSDDYYW